MTEQEKKIWYQFFSPSRFSVKRQYVIAPFIVDFYCPAADLVVEIDGVQHHSEQARIYDQRRTQYLESKGLKVLRFSNRQIDDDFDDIKNYLAEILQERIRGKR